jgi:hypothetical protein
VTSRRNHGITQRRRGRAATYPILGFGTMECQSFIYTFIRNHLSSMSGLDFHYTKQVYKKVKQVLTKDKFLH